MRLITTSLPRRCLAQLPFLVHIAVFQRQAGQHQQVLVLFPVARQYRDAAPVLDQAGDQTGPQESGAPENGYGLRTHPISEFESVARWFRARTLSTMMLAFFARFFERLGVRDRRSAPTPTIKSLARSPF